MPQVEATGNAGLGAIGEQILSLITSKVRGNLADEGEQFQVALKEVFSEIGEGIDKVWKAQAKLGALLSFVAVGVKEKEVRKPLPPRRTQEIEGQLRKGTTPLKKIWWGYLPGNEAKLAAWKKKMKKVARKAWEKGRQAHK